VCGKGGHGAHPHLTVDPVLIAAHIISAAQSIVARNVAPLEAAVVSLCAVQSGHLDAFSVVPREACVSGTVRAFNHSVQQTIEARLRELAESTARAFGGSAEVAYDRLYPATINHRPQYEFAAQVAEELVGREHVARNMPPSMGAEDFAFMLQAKPGCYARLGQGGGDACWLHSTRYDFNDAVIPLGSGFLAALAERRLPLAASA
jgi:amidohydrolase